MHVSSTNDIGNNISITNLNVAYISKMKVLKEVVNKYSSSTITTKSKNTDFPNVIACESIFYLLSYND